MSSTTIHHVVRLILNIDGRESLTQLHIGDLLCLLRVFIEVVAGVLDSGLGENGLILKQTSEKVIASLGLLKVHLIVVVLILQTDELDQYHVLGLLGQFLLVVLANNRLLIPVCGNESQPDLIVVKHIWAVLHHSHYFYLLLLFLLIQSIFLGV